MIEEDGPMPAVTATSMIFRIAEGLAAAHRNQIVHRDLKPDNVLITPTGAPKIADFGLAKRVRLDEEGPAKHLAGTPNFMAPELYNGEQATPSSDVYALGVCYFFLLTGRVPFTGDTFTDLMHSVLTEPVPSIRRECPDLTFEMAECLTLLLAKSPHNRPAHGDAASQLLEAVLGINPDIEGLLHSAFDGDDSVSWKRVGRTHQVTVRLDEGRTQHLFVETSNHPLADQLLMIYSTCCPAQSEYFEEALRLNSQIPHGGLSIRDIDGTPMFVMVDNYPRSTVDVEEVRRSVLEVGTRADQIEHLLTGLDKH